MNVSVSKISILPLLLSVLLLIACRQTETIVVEEGPQSLTDTVETERDTASEEFRRLVIGEYNSVNTFDPLFSANNPAAMRAVQLVYEGLVRMDDRAEIKPAVAKSWKVSDDSLTYRFALRSDVYYHDSEAFSAGKGRKLTAEDVKFVFERMARHDVPPDAGAMFMAIGEFEPFYQERRNLYNPVEWELPDIGGIQVPDDTTVIFKLAERDPHFLKKLSTPLSVIYPPEAVGGKPAEFQPVGTGPFRFSQQSGDTYIFARYNDHYSAGNIKLNRVDMRIFPDESELFQAFASGAVHLVPQTGPQIMELIYNEDESFSSAYAGEFEVDEHQGAVRYTILHNSNVLPDSTADAITGIMFPDTAAFLNTLPERLIERRRTAETTQDLSVENDTLFVTYSDDPFIRSFYQRLSSVLSEENMEVQMMKIRTPSRNIGLFLTVGYPLMEPVQHSSYREIGSFSVQHLSLRQLEISGRFFNRYPWWIDLRSASLP